MTTKEHVWHVRSKVLMVVYLPVVDNSVATAPSYHGLSARRRKIDNGQPAVVQRHLVLPHFESLVALSVRSPVGD